MERLSHPSEKIFLIVPDRLDLSLDFSQILEKLGVEDSSNLIKSLDENSILSPILTAGFQGGEKPLLVIDGFKRLRWARGRGLARLPVLRTGIMDKERLILFLLAKYSGGLKGCAAKALFLDYLVRAGFHRSLLTGMAMDALGLEKHGGLLDRYLRVAELPGEILRFCHEKDFSLKKCLNLTYQPRQLLEKIIESRRRISLSASLLLELCDNITDIMRRDQIDTHEFFQRQDVKEVLCTRMDIGQRTRLFRQLVIRLRFPVLTRLQDEVGRVSRAYFHDSPFSVRWDETLENRKITLSVTLRDLSELSELKEALSSSETEEGLKRLLSYF